MWFELVFCVNMQVGKLEEWSQGENKGKQGRKAKTQQNSQHPFPLCEIFAQHVPCAKFSHNTSLVRIRFCANFQICMLSVPSQNLSANFTRMRTLCEFVFVTNFQNHALYLGEPQECENFALPITLCEIRTSSLKAMFSSSNSKLLLHFSQHLSSDHPFPSLSSSPPSFPILSTTMAAHLHSRGLHYSPQSTPSIFSSFSSFHHKKTLQFFT